MRSKATSRTDIRTGEEWSRAVNRTAIVKGGNKRTVVKMKRETTNYKDMPMGGRVAMGTKKTGYKKVYKNGVLKKTKTY